MRKITNEALVKWLGAHPESGHPLDMERFYDFIRIADEQNDLDALMSIQWESLLEENQPDWCKEARDEFIEEWSSKSEFVVGYIKHTKN